jgi:hypothetical protein
MSLRIIDHGNTDSFDEMEIVDRTLQLFTQKIAV